MKIASDWKIPLLLPFPGSAQGKMSVGGKELIIKLSTSLEKEKWNLVIKIQFDHKVKNFTEQIDRDGLYEVGYYMPNFPKRASCVYLTLDQLGLEEALNQEILPNDSICKLQVAANGVVITSRTPALSFVLK